MCHLAPGHGAKRNAGARFRPESGTAKISPNAVLAGIEGFANNRPAICRIDRLSLLSLSHKTQGLSMCPRRFLGASVISCRIEEISASDLSLECRSLAC